MAGSASTPRRRFYRVEGGRRPRRRLSRWVAIGVVLAASAWVLLFGETGWLKVRAERHAVENLRRQTEELRAETTHLEANVEEIRQPGSPLLEKVARERYLMKREGDQVIHILDPSAEAAQRDSNP